MRIGNMKIENAKVIDFEVNEDNLDCVELINLVFSADLDGVPHTIELGKDDWFSINYEDELWEDPGVYPSNAGGSPLPSETVFSDDGVECSIEFTLDKIVNTKTEEEIDYDSITDEDWDKFYPILRDAGFEYFSEHSDELIRQILEIKYRDDGPDYDAYCDREEARLMDYYDRMY